MTNGIGGLVGATTGLVIGLGSIFVIAKGLENVGFQVGKIGRPMTKRRRMKRRSKK